MKETEHVKEEHFLMLLLGVVAIIAILSITLMTVVFLKTASEQPKVVGMYLEPVDEEAAYVDYADENAVGAGITPPPETKRKIIIKQ